MAADGFESRAAEEIRATAAQRYAVRDVTKGVALRQRFQVEVDRNALYQLPQFALLQFFSEFRLADQHDLQRLRAHGIDVGQHTDSLEIIDRQIAYLASAVRDAQKAGLVSKADPVSQARLVWALMSGTLGLARIENSLEPLRGMVGGVFAILGASPAAKTSRKNSTTLVFPAARN